MIDLIEIATLQKIFAVFSGLLALAFYLLILRDAWRKTVNPNPISWLIWGLNDTLILASSWSLGAINTLAVPIVYGVFSWIVLFVSLRNERKNPNLVERISLIFSAIGWLSYGAGLGALFSLIIGVVVNSLGYIPTIARLRKNSGAERRLPWTLLWLSSILSIASLETFRIDLLLFPFDSFVLNLVVLLLLRQRIKSAPLDIGRK